MPTYEYRCPDGHLFEKIQKISEKPRTKCPVCGKPAERQISGGSGLVFKGSGFYITDYGKDGKGPRKAPEGEKGPAEKTSDKPPEKGDAKAGAKPDAKPDTSAPAAKPEKAPAKKAAE